LFKDEHRQVLETMLRAQDCTKPSFIPEVPGISYCLVLSRLKRFGIDLGKCVGPRPELISRTFAFAEAKK